jgi:hypothetical protein
MTIAIVTPIGNEINEIENFYLSLKPILRENNATWITVFDNYCQDGTDVWLEDNKEDNIVITYNNKYKGLAGAYIHGNLIAIEKGFDKIIEVDIGHPIGLIGKFSDLLNKYPVVMGTRSSNDSSLFRKLISMFGTLLSHIILRLPYTDCTSGMQGFTSGVAKQIPWGKLRSTGHFYQTEFKFYCKNIPFCEVLFDYHGGASSLKFKAIIESLIILFQLRFEQPIIWSHKC